ncbi:HET-domain-containing protein [Glonium stellatum]|uniref:HET-domain-containing protein n=1 Tax=Glonium stellatum TaxID=574774 RepID=A0A8E2EZL1_9PEZI|nr:HET-domain-containing protein [Glonium stellatum]
MRLLNINTFQLETYNDEQLIPIYAILSHTWGEEEVLFKDIHNDPIKEEFQQLQRFCNEARNFGVSHVWIDTCCINKESSSELSEALNSMFSWYRNARLCIAYLSDVFTVNQSIDHSRWFTRGWTLQELIVPTEIWFYTREWKFIGIRSTLADQIMQLTGVNKRVLEKDGAKTLPDFSVAIRLSWAASRKTTRPEDRAYSLMGLFGVNIPTIYGEGIEAAFFRLQMEIYKTVPDHSILAWGDVIYSSWEKDHLKPEIRE